MNKFFRSGPSVQFIKFGTVGIINTGLDYLSSYILLSYIYQNHYLAQIFGFSVGLTNSYFLNKFWTFNKAKGGADRFLKFFIVGIIAMSCSVIMFWLLSWIDIGNSIINFYIKKTIATVVVTVINFLGAKYFVFLKKDCRLQKVQRMIKIKDEHTDKKWKSGENGVCAVDSGTAGSRK